MKFLNYLKPEQTPAIQKVLQNFLSTNCIPIYEKCYEILKVKQEAHKENLTKLSKDEDVEQQYLWQLEIFNQLSNSMKLLSDVLSVDIP